MADKEFKVKITAETDDFSRGMNRAEGESSGLGDTLKSDVSKGAESATESLKETIEELRRLQREAIGTKTSMSGMNNTFNETSNKSNKFNREMQRLSMILGGDVPESTKQAYAELAKLHREARTASRLYGKYSMEAMNARDAINTFALGLDDTTFKQIYMRSQLGLTDMQLRQQANSIKLNARMTKLMGNQTQILTQRMQGLAKHGIKPEMLLPPSTIGQFQLLNETMAAGRSPLNALSSGYRKLGGSVEKVIKNYSAQKVAIREARGDMVKYGLLLRGITAANANLALAFPIVGLGAFYAYKTMFNAAFEADKSLKKLAETTKGKVLKALEPLISTAGQFLKVALEVVGVVSDWITKFNEAHPIIAKILGVIGLLLPAMTLLLLPLQMGIGLWKGWMVALNGVWTMFGGVVAMIGTASSTFLAFAGIVGVLVGAFIYLWKTNEGFRDACITIWEAIKTTIQTALEAIQQFFITHGDTIKSVLQTAYETLKNIVMTVMNTIGEIVKLILDSIKQFWNQHGQTITQAVKTIYETIKTIVQTYLQALSDFIKIILDNIKQFWDKHGESLKQVAKAAWDMIKTIISNVLKVIQSIILAVSSAINGDWDTFWQQMGNIVKIAWDTICNFVKFAIQNIPRIISAGSSLVVSAMKSLLQGAVNAAKSFGTAMLNVGKDLIKGLANGIKSGASWVVNSITGAVKGAINAGKKLLGINSPSKLFMQFGEWTTEGYQIGVDRGEPKSTRAVENFADRSINAFSEAENYSINESALSSNSINNSISNIDYNKFGEVLVKSFARAIESTGMNNLEVNIDSKKMYEAISPQIGRAVRGW
ncbi:hypothetical protein H8697_00870 [[Eubacterium] tenue]|nr:hypothetical protein [[Eubacterium] tenue]MBC8630262.1 hypothetical protein [[Eubacterium] tenue]